MVRCEGKMGYMVGVYDERLIYEGKMGGNDGMVILEGKIGG